jgi:LmbE family N-acetylglucosaminyl deacetylase
MNLIFPDGRLLFVMAHYDDEVLFCGGALSLLAELDAPVTIAIVTSVAETNNYPTAGPVELLRQLTRLAAFNAVCQKVRALQHHFELPRVADGASVAKHVDAAIQREAPLAIITHGDEIHPQHIVTAKAVKDAAGTIPVFHRSLAGQAVRFSNANKGQLLQLYRTGGHRNQEWRPENYPEYAPWCYYTEHYDR